MLCNRGRASAYTTSCMLCNGTHGLKQITVATNKEQLANKIGIRIYVVRKTLLSHMGGRALSLKSLNSL